jgi:hypothetical protein
MYLAKASQICSLREHHLDVDGRKILQKEKTSNSSYFVLYLSLCNSDNSAYHSSSAFKRSIVQTLAR